jgi:hypothetical protein
MCYILKTITCVLRRRNLVKNGQNNINLIRLFSYTLKHYVVYFYEYLCKLKDSYTTKVILSELQFSNKISIFSWMCWWNSTSCSQEIDNTIVQETNGVIVFNM